LAPARDIPAPPVYVSMWSLRRTIIERHLALHQLPALLADHGFDGMELTDRELRRVPDEELEAFEDARASHGTGLILDIGCDLTRRDRARTTELQHVRAMLARCRELNVHTARITLGGQTLSMQQFRSWKSRFERTRGASTDMPYSAGPDFLHWMRRMADGLRRGMPAWAYGANGKIERAISALRLIVTEAQTNAVRLGIENHWGISARPGWIMQIVNSVDSPWLGTCPDFGNFPAGVDVYDGLAQLAPQAVHVQAKSWNFDARGEETRLDYARCLGPFVAAGYQGAITIEYEGNGDELVDCERTRVLINKHWLVSANST